jgi:hypothetical protein
MKNKGNENIWNNQKKIKIFFGKFKMKEKGRGK